MHQPSRDLRPQGVGKSVFMGELGTFSWRWWWGWGKELWDEEQSEDKAGGDNNLTVKKD